MASPLSQIDEVDWKSLSHAYGSAEDVPAMLRAFAFGSPKERSLAFEGWWGTIIHQGTYYSATVAVTPYLIEIVLHPATRERYEIIDEVQEIGRGWIEQQSMWRPRQYFQRYFVAKEKRYDDSPFVQAAFQAVSIRSRELCRSMLVDEQSPEDITAMAFLLSILVDDPQQALSTLLTAYDLQTLSRVRAQILVAIKELLVNCQSCGRLLPVETSIQRMRSVAFDENSDVTAGEKAAAALTLLQFGNASDETRSLELLSTLKNLDQAIVESRSNMRSWDLPWMIKESLERKPELQQAWILRELKTTDVATLRRTIRLATSYCERHRSGPEAFVPVLVGLLEEATGELRSEILAALSGLGTRGLSELERLASQQNDHEAAKALDSFRQSWNLFLIRQLDELPTPPVQTTDPLAAAEQFLDNANLPVRIKAIREYLKRSGDRERTVQLAAASWRADFVALPLLDILGECGDAARELVPELESLSRTEERCVSRGWLHGLCSLDEAIIEAAQAAISRIRCRPAS